MANKVRKIAVFSGKRGGFGALMGVMSIIDKDPELELCLMLTDMHLSNYFGYTANEVEKFFKVSHKLSLDQKNDSGLERSAALGRCVIKVAKALNDVMPDILILLGDRGEVLSAAIAAMELNIPIAHILGGDVVGNRDGSRIHSITKISHIHFPSSLDSYNRILKLGEEKWRVHNVGATYVDYIIQKKYTRNDMVREKYGILKKEKYVICIQHPTTLEESKSYEESSNLFSVLHDLKLKTVIIYPCSDQGYLGVVKAINEFSNVSYFNIYKNIEAFDFWGLMSGAMLFIGNSSSGLMETPYFNLPTVNLGRRQKGRVRDNNVLDSSYSKKEIKAAIEFATSNKFVDKIRNNNIFGEGCASTQIVEIIKNVDLNNKLLMKEITF